MGTWTPSGGLMINKHAFAEREHALENMKFRIGTNEVKHASVCLYACMQAFMYVCVYVCMYVCTYVCMYVCMYGY